MSGESSREVMIMFLRIVLGCSFGISRMLSLAIVLAITMSVSLAQQQTVADKSSEDHVTILVSGDLSRMRAGTDLSHPEGGLGDDTHGVVGEVKKLDPNHKSLRLLAGNNLGRAVKAG